MCLKIAFTTDGTDLICALFLIFVSDDALSPYSNTKNTHNRCMYLSFNAQFANVIAQLHNCTEIDRILNAIVGI